MSRKTKDNQQSALIHSGASAGAKKPWSKPVFSIISDLSKAQVGRGVPTDFKLKGAKNPPGQS